MKSTAQAPPAVARRSGKRQHGFVLGATGTIGQLLPRLLGLVLSAAVLAGAATAGAAGAAQTTLAPAGDAERGRAWLLQRFETGCILCHEVPGLPAGGNLGPPLRALAERYSAAQVRDRIADARRFNPQTIMPPYASITGLQSVAPAYQGKTVLTEQALQDIVAYLLKPAPQTGMPVKP